jgi:disulfide bond formation protein DsbB
MSFALASLMIIFGAATFASDSSVSRELIIGGVALISIILTAYTAFATYEDVKTRKEENEIL